MAGKFRRQNIGGGGCVRRFRNQCQPDRFIRLCGVRSAENKIATTNKILFMRSHCHQTEIFAHNSTG